MSAIEYQRLILADKVRNDVFVKALKRALKPGMTVADIGSGTGFLSFVAKKAGAKQVTMYEANPDFANLSNALIAENKLSGIELIECFSHEIENPPKADIVISETLGNYALEENILEILADAHRFLKPRGTLMPQRLRQFVAPVIDPRIWKETMGSWDKVGFGLTWKAAQEVSCNNMYVKTIAAKELLPKGTQQWDDIDFLRTDNASVRKATLEWKMEKPRTIYGFALWWECDVIKGVTLSTSPSAAATHWQQIFLPALAPISVKKGERLSLKITSDTRMEIRVNLAWEISHYDAKGKRKVTMKLDMRNG